MPDKHGDISNPNVKADKESHLKILLQVPPGMYIQKATLKDFEVSIKKEFSLELCKSLYDLKQAVGI